ncbi:MAG: hypothetical protein IV100_08705 [Myxococcales bacterium]|nr:hypothetical protein [Myxococcales bacterium]
MNDDGVSKLHVRTLPGLVPWTEAEQIVKAVRANDVPVWYLLFNDEGHGFQKKTNSDYFGAASVLFWQQHLLAP